MRIYKKDDFTIITSNDWFGGLNSLTIVKALMIGNYAVHESPDETGVYCISTPSGHGIGYKFTSALPAARLAKRWHKLLPAAVLEVIALKPPYDRTDEELELFCEASEIMEEFEEKRAFA